MNLFLEQSIELRKIMSTIPYDFKDKTVLELGPLVGVHSHALQLMGAKYITSIEGRQQNFEECLYNKKLYNMDKCNFILANIKGEILKEVGNFDICVAFRVLHHLNNSYQVLKKISKITDNICIYYRVASDNCPDGKDIMIHGFKGKRCTEGFNRVSGMQKYSIWLYKEELLRMLNSFGYINIVVSEGEEPSFIEGKNCKYIILLACKENK